MLSEFVIYGNILLESKHNDSFSVMFSAECSCVSEQITSPIMVQFMCEYIINAVNCYG